MTADIVLGVIVLAQLLMMWRQNESWREERRLLINREYAKSVPELATLQHITKPQMSKSAIAQLRKEGISEPEKEPRAPSLPFGL